MMMWIIVFCLLTSAVLTEQGEVARGYVGENVTMEFSKPSKVSFLYHYDKKVSIIQECECLLFPGTQFAGRLRCSREEFNTTCKIIIQNVTQRDAGLYKVVREDTVMEERFLNITGTASTSTLSPVTLQGNMTRTQLHQVSTEAHYSQRTPVKPNSTNTITMNTGTQDPSRAGSQLISVSSRSQASSPSTHGTASTTTTSTLNPVTLQGNMTRTQLHQVSTVAQNNQRSPLKSDSNNTRTMNKVALDASSAGTLSHSVSTRSQANSLSTQSTAITVGIPGYVIPVVFGVVGVIMLMVGFLIWIQRRNANDLDRVQRLILEKCETPSVSTPNTIRRTIPMPAWEEGRADRSIPRAKALHDAILGLYCSANPRNADSVDTLYSSIHSLENCVDEKPEGDHMFCCNESSERSNTLFHACDESTEMGILVECPSICTLVSKSGGEKFKTICAVQGKVAKSIQDLLEKVNDEPTVSSKYYKNFTATGNADSLCRNEYQMEAISIGIVPEDKFQDVKIASESTETSAASCQGTLWSRKEFVHGTEEDNGYETFENIKYTTPVQNDKASKNVKSLTIKDEEPKEGKRISDKASNDYIDVDF